MYNRADKVHTTQCFYPTTNYLINQPPNPLRRCTAELTKYSAVSGAVAALHARVCEVLAPALEAAAQQQSAEGMEGLSQELERSVREVRAAIQTHAADAPRKDALLLRVSWGAGSARAARAAAPSLYKHAQRAPKGEMQGHSALKE